MIKLDYNDFNAEYRKYHDTMEDHELVRTFDRKLSKVYDEIKKDMLEWLPNLSIFIACDGELSLWVRGLNQGINTPQTYNIGSLHTHQVQFLLWVNDKVKKIIDEPDKYFWCNECGTVQPRENFKDNVFAGYYCKDCYNNNEEIKALIDKSKQRGFYD